MMEQKRFFCILKDIAGSAVWLRWIDGDTPSIWVISLNGDRFDHRIIVQAKLHFDGSVARFEDAETLIDIRFSDKAGHVEHGNALSRILFPSKKYENVFLDSTAEGIVKVHGSVFRFKDSNVAVACASGRMPHRWQWMHRVDADSIRDSVSVPVCWIAWISSEATLEKKKGTTTKKIHFARSLFNNDGKWITVGGLHLMIEDAIQISYPDGVSSYTFLYVPEANGSFLHVEAGGSYGVSCRKKIDCTKAGSIFTG